MKYTVYHNDGTIEYLTLPELKEHWKELKVEQDFIFNFKPGIPFIVCACGIQMRFTRIGHFETLHKNDIVKHREDCPHCSKKRKNHPAIKDINGKYDVKIKIKMHQQTKAQSGGKSAHRKNLYRSSSTRTSIDSVSRLGEIISALYIQDSQSDVKKFNDEFIGKKLYNYAKDNVLLNGHQLDRDVTLKIKEVLKINKNANGIKITTHLGSDTYDDDINDSFTRFSNSHNGLQVESALKNGACKVIMIEYSSRLSHDSYPAEFFLCNKYGLFCDSLYEAAFYNDIFDYLSSKQSNKLQFIKPLISYGEYDNINYISDGIFYTIGKNNEKKIETVIEVFGLNDADYLIREREKISTCKYPLLTWKPNEGQELSEAMDNIKKFIDRY